MAKLYRRDGVYYLDFLRDGVRRRRSLKTRDRDLAKKLYAKALYELNQERDPFRRADAPIATFLAAYEADMRARKSPATVLGEQGRIDMFFRLWLHGRTKLSQIRREDIEGYVEARLKGESIDRRPKEEREKKLEAAKENGGRRYTPTPATQATVNNDLRVVRAALNWAVTHDMLHRNPFQGIRLFKTPAEPPRFIPADKIPKLLEEAEKLGLKEYVALGLWAGLRKAEIAWLEWQDIDWERRTVTVRNKQDRFGPHARVKSYEARTIPLHSKLTAILEPVRCDDGFVVAPDVKPAPGKRYRYFPSTAWRLLGKNAKLEGELTVHALRHTFASHLVMASVSIFKVSKWLGHRDVRTTMVYAHLAPQDRDIDRLTL